MAMDINKEKRPEEVTTIEKPKPTKKCSGKAMGSFITVVFILLVLVAIGFVVDKYTDVSLFGQKSANVEDNNEPIVVNGEYTAVFLTNGQVYFGKVASVRGDNTVLIDIYYLQVSNPLQQTPPAQASQQPQLSLVKLGNELHGPQDEMVINNDHILFTERLKGDGKVVQAIAKYQQDQAQ